MKRVLTISAQRNSKNLTVINTMQHGAFPSKNDISQTIKVNQEKYLELVLPDSKLPLLPQNVRWCSSDRRSLLVEEPPGYKEIVFRKGAKLDMKHKVSEVKLPMPWLYYGISPDKNKQPFVSHLFGSPFPLGSSKYSALYFIPIPNVFKYGAICTHTLTEEISDLPYHLQVNRAIGEFWDSIFNHDVNHYSASRLFNYMHKKAYSLGTSDCFVWWEKQTPETICDISLDYWDPITTSDKIGQIMLKFNDFYSLSADQSGLLMSQMLVSAMEIAQAP